MNQTDASLARARAQARLRRGMFLLPSLFTVGNIAAGYVSITQTMAALTGIGDVHQHLDWAAIAILIAIPLDSLDGRIARMTNTCSDFGKELDSLADAITFGVAPSLLALIWGFHFLSEAINPQMHENLLHAGAFICFLFLIGGVSRLAHMYRDQLRPQAEATLQSSVIAYENDKTSLLDLLDSQMEVINVDLSWLDAAANFDARLADLELATGTPLDPHDLPATEVKP